jgi:Lysyl oxidase
MDRNDPFRVWVVALAAAAALVALLAALLVANAPAGAASDREPDLRMDQARSLQIQNTGGRKLLRFDSIVVNAGAGPFELRGTENTGSSQMRKVEQRIFDDAGGSRYVTTPATMVFGGDGHNHWHVRNLQDFELTRLDNGAKVSPPTAKMGFCFFDNVRYSSSTPQTYTQPTGACAGGSSAAQTMMGLSPGWGDLYGANLPDQYIDITGQPAGRYRLTLIADQDNWFVEGNNANNFSWIDIQLGAKKPRIVAVGPGA